MRIALSTYIIAAINIAMLLFVILLIYKITK